MAKENEYIKEAFKALFMMNAEKIMFTINPPVGARVMI